MLDAGLRRSEAINLRWEHMYLDRGYLQVVAGKSVNAKRAIPLTERVKKLLTALPRIDDFVSLRAEVAIRRRTSITFMRASAMI